MPSAWPGTPQGGSDEGDIRPAWDDTDVREWLERSRAGGYGGLRRAVLRAIRMAMAEPPSVTSVGGDLRRELEAALRSVLPSLLVALPTEVEVTEDRTIAETLEHLGGAWED